MSSVSHSRFRAGFVNQNRTGAILDETYHGSMTMSRAETEKKRKKADFPSCAAASSLLNEKTLSDRGIRNLTFRPKCGILKNDLYVPQ